jgi:flagellar operon protein
MNIDPQRLQAHLGGIRPVSDPNAQPARPKTPAAGEPFADALQKARKAESKPNVTVSSHATERLLQRGISLDQADLQKIDEAMNRAEAKGARESLFVMRDLALVVSVENRTVITALHGDGAKENVFTNIDSAVIVE